MNLAKPQRGGTEQSQYGRASESAKYFGPLSMCLIDPILRVVWESEDWLKKNAKPVGQGGEATEADTVEGGDDEAEEAMEE